MAFKSKQTLTKLLMALTFLFTTHCGDSGNDSTDIDINPGKNNQQEVPDSIPNDPPVDEEDEQEDDGSIEPNPFKNEQASTSSSFLRLPDGRKLSDVKVRSSSLRLASGRGKAFTSSNRAAYQKLKRDSQTEKDHKVQWTFMNLETGQIIERSLEADRKIFGASSSKIYVAAALLDRQAGELSKSQTQKMADMLVVSSNTAWKDLQKQVGSGSANKGRERIHRFTQRMGYEKTRGFQGYWGDLHGNELTPDESAATLYDIYQNNFKGAETLWKIMYTCRTGTNRGRKYLPSDLYVGGKTGSYSGPTENPQTGETYNVRVKNHLLIFAVDGIQYGLAVLANSGSDESAALLAGGLIRDYTSIK